MKAGKEQRGDTPQRFTRREATFGLVAGAVSGAAGIALGYKYRHRLHDIWRATVAGGSADTPGAGTFVTELDLILARRARQTPKSAAELRAAYAKPLIGEVRMWDIVQDLAGCIDVTDQQMFAASQLVHVRQVLAAMERDGVDDPDMHLIALLHDAGKVALLHGGKPEDILGGTRRMGEPDRGVGLERADYQFSHGDFISTRVKDYVPEHVTWVLRFHGIDIDDAVPFMTAKERGFTERYLRPFRRFDAGFKSFHYAPDVDMAGYRELIEGTFPEAVLF